MFGNAAHWKRVSSLARPLREGQVEREIRRAQRLVGESMRLQAPNVRIFALKSSRGGLCTCSELLLIGRAKFRISLRLEQKLPLGGPPTEALDGGRALLGPFARVKWRVKSDEP